MPIELPDIASTARSPEAEFNLRAQGKAFPTQGFNQQESNLLQTQMQELMTPLEGSVIGELVQQRQSAIGLTAAFAKQVFDEKLFGGINADDNEIAFDVLRPGQIRADPGDGSIGNDWYFEPDASGWNDWIGDGASNNYTVGEDQVSVVLAFYDQDVNSEISAVNVDEFGRNVNMIPEDLNDLRLRDNPREQQVKPLPTLIAQENDDVHVRLRHDRVAESQPRLLGFTFGLGSFLNTEDYSA